MIAPDISFVIASYNAAAFLAAAVQSALDQRGVRVEVLVIDDGSSDDSVAIAQSLAATDPRVRCFRTPTNLGPGGARNIGFDAAQGRWIAVLDSDDLLHPDRARRLLAEAAASGADMIADDLLLFDDARIAQPSLFLGRQRAKKPSWIALPDYLDETRMYGRRPNLGFLKPMILAERLRRSGIRYDERLRIAEDDALVIALLRDGARYRLLPQPCYFYRKHGASISHRLSSANADRMRAAGDELATALAGDPALRRALAPRNRALHRAWAFAHLIDALKARALGRAVAVALRNPTMLPMLRAPLLGAGRKLLNVVRKAPPRPTPDPRRVVILSRQRLIGATNGSSAYLIAIAQAVRAAGFVPHLFQPSPVIFGRTPFFRLLPEMSVFDSIEVRRTLRIGAWLITLDPSVWLDAMRGGLASVLRRAGVSNALSVDRKRPPSISMPWHRADLLGIASYARAQPAVILADYIYQADALPYFLAPDARTATVMHDLFHTRADQFASGSDSLEQIDRDGEIALLSAADAVLAIQATEARFVADHVPGAQPILVPMPAQIVANAQPGHADRILFVGSNTAPNVLGLQWFFDETWPVIRAANPAAELVVAGTVGRAFPSAPGGVRFLGLVPDLAAAYRDAGVVISPLLQGSGLKIKLIEAMAHGKASVVTATTLQGVENELRGALIQADQPADFAQAVLSLQRDPALRERLAGAALIAAQTHFGPERSMTDFTKWLTGR